LKSIKQLPDFDITEHLDSEAATVEYITIVTNRQQPTTKSTGARLPKPLKNTQQLARLLCLLSGKLDKHMHKAGIAPYACLLFRSWL